MKRTTYVCDKCNCQSENESEMVLYVEVTYCGHGAAKDNINGIDLCRKCYSDMVTMIREFFKKNGLK